MISLAPSSLAFFRSKSSDRSPDEMMQYATTERNFGEISEKNFYDIVLAHGDGTLVNVPSDKNLKGNFTNYVGFCICRYVDTLSIIFIGFIICTTIISAIVIFVAVTKLQNEQRQERRAERSPVMSQHV